MSYWGMSIEVQIRSGWDIWEGETGHPDKGMSKNEELSPANKDYITFESITLIRVIKPEIFTYLYFRGQWTCTEPISLFDGIFMFSIINACKPHKQSLQTNINYLDILNWSNLLLKCLRIACHDSSCLPRKCIKVAGDSGLQLDHAVQSCVGYCNEMHFPNVLLKFKKMKL